MKFYKKYLAIFAAFFLIISSFVGCSSSKTIDSSKDANNQHVMKVNYIDVGQGDSILVQVNGKNLLIDAGPNSSTDKLISYLNKQNIKKLDFVVATHPHEDHIGAMDTIINKYNIGEFYAPKKTTTTKTFESMVNALKSKNIKINAATAGVSLDLGKNVKCEMIAPNAPNYEDLNNYSAVIKITYGNSKFLFMGDAESLSEKEILNKNHDISSDVLKLGHHGSSSSSSKAFLDKVSPKIAIISCGKNNDYGHPHKETSTEMKKRNIQVYRTDIDGSIVLISDGKKISKE
ncbi:ComEC/Rec2 family competence protein [Clostridium magnum]|uniref:Hydroxyacylglutathione hydrolase n=1 Tax=Clostridium magnum DSM 2767 TaxID=1121326 RepID=A0A162RER8_9CLOT|nr:hydroxyacylglutathione hydrolase [Clostridium magnum DSM 2767]SHI68183.1 competence protein ComEC [Clostridium magnum DSM 2767]